MKPNILEIQYQKGYAHNIWQNYLQTKHSNSSNW